MATEDSVSKISPGVLYTEPLPDNILDITKRLVKIETLLLVHKGLKLSSTVADAVTQDLSGLNTVDKIKLEADLTSCKNAINAIIDKLQSLGFIL